MKADQTAYAAAVADLWLEGGVDGSKAKHQSIQRYYAEIERDVPPPKLQTPELKSFESRIKYDQRVADSIVNQMQPAWKHMQAKAAQGVQNAARARDMQETAKDTQERLKRSQELLKASREEFKQLQAPFVGLSREQVKPLIAKALQMQHQNEQEKQQRRKDKGHDLGR